MVKTILVGPDLALGEEVLNTLDKTGFPITVALWLLRKERSEDWKLVVATPLYDKLGAHAAYLKLIAALSTQHPVSLAELPLRLESNKRPMIKALRKTFGRAASVHGMRLGSQSIGGIWIDDAYVYRAKP
jgi:hypothetical protein